MSVSLNMLFLNGELPSSAWSWERAWTVAFPSFHELVREAQR